ncbi:cytochrome P450 [Xylaria scruposa]|nr:cytochrome P450 [Xylaria scruposa]
MSWHTMSENKLPPAYPSLIPIFGHIIPFLWDNRSFFERLTSYQGKATGARVSLLGHDLFLFQDQQSILKIWATATLSSPIKISTYTFKYFFGVPEETLAVYNADSSGPFRRPYPGSTVPEQRRVDYLSHNEFLRALSGPGLEPTVQRFKAGLDQEVNGFGVSDDWQEQSSFQDFLGHAVCSPMVKAIFGPALISLNPGFVEDLFEFDANVPWLARGLPSWLIPKAHRAREKLAGHFRRWHAYSKQHFTCADVYEDGDGDPYWGSAFIRNRHTIFTRVGGHSDDAIVALDIGLSFGLISNTSPATILMAWHIFKDPELLQRIRNELRERVGAQSYKDVHPKVFLGSPLLQSVYAEVLRLYTNVYIMVSPPQGDVNLGRWRLPKGAIALLNTCISHHDPQLWNTRGGLHPVNEFWADRFLIYPGDKSSGPVNPGIKNVRDKARLPSERNTEPFFSTAGLDASWFPYGGGHSICPGRHLAKTIIIFTCVMLVSEFDIEILTDTLDFNSWRFGLGISKPKNSMPFRVRRRNHK